MTSDIAATPEGAPRPSRLSSLARKLSAITLLALALSFVRPSDMPAGGDSPKTPGTTMPVALGTVSRLPPTAVLYREVKSNTFFAATPTTMKRPVIMSVARQVV